ncbi:hypothetical protein FOYG_17455 [Fusarium oxysporum NRRL 32931]|uniref:Zn(2)-C6 fungal-type domain-containing protein n=1 Tax=Fusarium oxysporum NRRL 32931 TaxID=660029 RepID=W9HAW0_FUSOX|nr:hypothetical protein FOYG_17455 [Fusarium oxysporum NRRL 32931]
MANANSDMTLDLNENGFGAGHSPDGATGPTQAKKRKKYAVKACHDCKRRKVKCSGGDACLNCRSREIKCRYSPIPPTVEGDAERRRIRSGASSSNAIVRQTRHSTSVGARVPSSALSDPRVDELYDRVRSIECTLTQLLKSAKDTEDSSPGVTFLTPAERSVTVPDEEDDDGDQFALPPTTHDDLTLSSQVAAMSALLSRPPSPKPGSSCRQTATFQVLIQFPDTSTLQHLLDVYFRDMNSYFPFLNRQDIELRIYSVVGRLGYSSYNRSVAVTKEDLSIIALTYIMLAMADCVDPGEGACDGDAKPGWERYLQSCRAIQHFSHSKTLNLDVVRAQCLVAAYLMHVEVLRAASQAISAAWQQAISIRLNDKKTWPAEDAQEILQRQQLWWTMYFLDRQISRRSGIAYHIRDTEFDVDDFTVHPENNVTQQTKVTESYLQALISLARLWGRVWDTFFAVGATNKGDWMEVELMDARILNARRGLPKTLTWDSNEIFNYAASDEDEPRIRRRLQIFTRLELLRMLIKQNPIRQSAFNPETAHFCARLSREIIRSHHLYFLQYPEVRASGYFATSSIVECIYHLAPVIHRSIDSNEHSACVSAFNQAHGILVKLSVYTNVAKKALRALNGVIKKWGSGDSISIATTIKDTSVPQGEVQNVDDFDAPPEIQEFMRRTDVQVGTEGFDIHIGDLMDVSMGWLPGSEFDLRPDVLH